jgi:hypothetical protein
MSEVEIRQEILKQLSFGACCRYHIHNECLKFGLDKIEENRTSDRRFDKPFDKLIEEGYVRKVQPESIRINGDERKNWRKIDLTELVDPKNQTIEMIGKFAFYELTEKGKKLIN